MIPAFYKRAHVISACAFFIPIADGDWQTCAPPAQFNRRYLLKFSYRSRALDSVWIVSLSSIEFGGHIGHDNIKLKICGNPSALKSCSWDFIPSLVSSCNRVWKCCCSNAMFRIEINKQWERFFTLLYWRIRDFCGKLFHSWPPLKYRSLRKIEWLRELIMIAETRHRKCKTFWERI